MTTMSFRQLSAKIGSNNTSQFVNDELTHDFVNCTFPILNQVVDEFGLASGSVDFWQDVKNDVLDIVVQEDGLDPTWCMWPEKAVDVV